MAGLGVLSSGIDVFDDLKDMHQINQGTSDDQEEYKKYEKNNSKYAKSNGSVVREKDGTSYAIVHTMFTGIMDILSNIGSFLSKWIGVIFGPFGWLAGIVASLVVSMGVVAFGKWLWAKYIAKAVRKWLVHSR
ncbi:hypothetical protein [Leuconostoc inhae]